MSVSLKIDEILGRSLWLWLPSLWGVGEIVKKKHLGDFPVAPKDIEFHILTTQTQVSSKSGKPVKFNRTCTFRVHRWRRAWCLQSCMHEMDVFCVCVCVGVVYMWVCIGMTFLPNVLPPPKKARPSRCPSNQENAPLPNLALLPIGENMGTSRHIGHRFYNLRPSSISAFLIGIQWTHHLIQHGVSFHENLGEHDMDIACSAQRFGLGIFCPKVLARKKKRHVIGVCDLWTMYTF